MWRAVGLAPASLLHNFKDNGLEVPATAMSTVCQVPGPDADHRASWHDRAQEKENAKLSDNKGQMTFDRPLLPYAPGMRIRKMLVIGNYI